MGRPLPGFLAFLDESLKLPYHLAIHGTQGSWFSAFPTEGSDGAAIDTGGKLRSSNSRLIDRPQNMLYFGDLTTPAQYSSALAYFQAMEIADLNYDDGLTYCLMPELNRAIQGSCNGYNSNSYAIGLIKSVGPLLFVPGGAPVVTIVDQDRIPGSEKPVPNSEF